MQYGHLQIFALLSASERVVLLPCCASFRNGCALALSVSAVDSRSLLSALLSSAPVEIFSCARKTTPTSTKFSFEKPRIFRKGRV